MLASLDAHAHAFEQTQHGVDIAQFGKIGNLERLARQEARGEDRKRGVLRARDRDLARKALPPGDDELIHARLFSLRQRALRESGS